jgi:hypothetical protein
VLWSEDSGDLDRSISLRNSHADRWRGRLRWIGTLADTALVDIVDLVFAPRIWIRWIGGELVLIEGNGLVLDRRSAFPAESASRRILKIA